MKVLRQLILDSTIAARVLALALMLASFSVSAQGVLSGSRTQTGTIQAELQDEGFLVISGQRYSYDNELTLVYLNGELVENEILDEGLVVRYTTNSSGVLTGIEILGPANRIQSFDDN